ncbi:MAG TPA: aspartate aminotransferase, partial [Gammaproteobacteria bacterium]|nr:aspartate aminotransferase [Gammaproteobacteria bacterium]
MTVSRTTLEKGTAFMSWDQEIDRTLSNSKRWQGRGDAIALTIGDSDFKLAQPIRRAILARLDEGVIGYDAVPTSLVELIVSRLHDRYGWVVDPDWLVFISGVVPGLNIAGRGLTGPEQVLVTEVPVYYPFLDVSENSNRRMIKLPAQAGSTRWEFDLDRLEAIAKTNNVGVLILCNPQNPL